MDIATPNGHEKALEVFNKICSFFDDTGWKYMSDADNLFIGFGVGTDDVPMTFTIYVDPDLQLVRFYSPMPFAFKANQLVEGSVAACVASEGVFDGNFEFDINSGRIMFRMTTSFMGSDISLNSIKYMLAYSQTVVDKYNDGFFDLAEGRITINQFISKFKKL